MPKISFKNDIDCKTKEIKGEGLGKIPTDIERMIEKNRDKVISKITIFRLPLADELVKMLNLLTNDSVKKFLKKDDQHDRLFHLGLFLETTDNKHYVYDKQANFSFVEASKSFLKQKDIELSPVSNLPANLTIGELVEAGKKRMGRRFTYYSALKWNCQYFVQQSLEAIDATFNVQFVIQDLSQLVKKIPAFQRKFGVALTTFAREADKVLSHTKDAINDTTKDVKKGTSKAVKKTKRFLGFGYDVKMY
jgi:ElaB/YqjD/DUF883 family membrane-anchored ribosome-binding protein